MSLEPPQAKERNQSIPEELNSICHRCLEKIPADRFGSALELSTELNNWLAKQTSKQDGVGKQVFISHSNSDQEFVEREIVGV